MNKTEFKNKSVEVSVIVPIFKVENYIHECIDSILAQTFTDFEIILVDDGSSDRCGEICDEYAKKDARITVVHKTNGGLSDARNFGMAQASGKYLFFLDGDDRIDPKLLERAVACIREGYDLVVFNNYISYNNKNEKSVTHQTGVFEINDDLTRKEFFFDTFLLSKIGWSTSDRLFNREIISKNNIVFADNKKIFLEDLFFSCCYCSYTKRILSIEDRLFYYRQREDSIMHTDGLEVNFNRINELGKELLKYYNSHSECGFLLDVFPRVYFMIFYNCLTCTRKVKEAGLKNMRSIVLDDIDDDAFFLDQMKKMLKQKALSGAPREKYKLSEMKAYARLFLNGNVTGFKLKTKINGLRKQIRGVN